MSWLGSRSKKNKLEYVSSYDTSRFGKVCTLREAENSAKSKVIVSWQIYSRDFQARPSAQIEGIVLIFSFLGLYCCSHTYSFHVAL